MTVFNGYLLGLGFVIFIGPVFFYLLKCTLDAGFLSGVAVALGIVFADFLCILICSFGAIPFFKNQQNQFLLGIFSGLILLFLGLKFIFKPKLLQLSNLKIKVSKTNYISYFAHGFLINFINPFVFVVWIGIIGIAETKYSNSYNFFFFLGSVLVGVFSEEFLKVILANRIKAFLNPLHLIKIYRFFGIILLIFSTWIFVYSFMHHQ
ncbi:MAG: lysine transporter LysE [Flavobacteriales bacterium CG_4_9_14_3_um_filter_32_8]|nr:MAG: lysine transporter LysE [Flavobacteriales bacterium CG_4_9_14_3_um_filter_32_8]